MSKLIKKEALFRLINLLLKKYTIIAPVKRDIVPFEAISDPRQIYLKKNSYFPVKEFFFKSYEVLFRFNRNKLKVPKNNNEKRIFFGLRRCDLNSIARQDIAFIKEETEPYYKKLRENSLLIGYHCYKAEDEYCFCGSMGLLDFYDLMLYPKNKYFLVETGSKKGLGFIKKYKRYFKDTKIELPDKKISKSDRLQKRDISLLYNHPDWQKAVELCLSCAACNLLCPSCYCFDIKDEVEINLSKGMRFRTWASCQLRCFTRVAGDYIFRDKREDRFKHRIYHQLQYFKEKHGINLCTGCGRCIRGCPTRIDFVKLINEMKP